MYLIWHRQQVFSPIARRFLTQVSATLKEERQLPFNFHAPP